MPAVVAGAALMVVNSSVSAMDGVIVRLIAGEVHPLGIVFFRNFFSLIFLAVLLPAAWRVSPPTDGLLWVHVLRAVMKLLALAAAFIAVTRMPLSSATAIAFTTPLFVALGSVLFLGERLYGARVTALVLGFVGVLIVLRQGAVGLDAGAAWALAGAIGLAGVALLMKFSAGREEPLRIVWLNLLVTVPVAFLLSLPVWATPSLYSIGLLALQGAAGLLAQFSLARAMRVADASLLVVVDFIRLPLAMVFGLTLFDEPVQLAVVIGGGIILAAVLLLFHRETGRPT